MPAAEETIEPPPVSPPPPGASPVDPPSAGSGCRPPADVRREVERYEAAATVGAWQGPRYRMTYRILGDGPPLIWIPGIAATHRVYALVLNRLAERFRTIQYAYPGDDPSDGARLGRIRHEHLADDLFGLIDHLRLGRAFLAGLSFGSTVVLRAIAREPRRFPRSIVQGAFARRKFSMAERLALALGRCVPGTAAGLPLRERVLTYNSKPDFPAILQDRWPFYLEQNGLTPIRALAHRTSLVAGLDLRPTLENIHASLLLIQGREDRIVPWRYFEELKSLLPHAEAAVLPTVGHIPHLTHAELLARVVGEWLLPCPEGGPCSRDAGSRPGLAPA
ncbi:alpha/beta fold hydrolase [Aquisphaera insulae]|uniref:alpha/beta fold hydrolase n=1 Tax=Aquisphaera insulae TaxID=2712864 RepID=UPI0013ED5435|nr:alpha/beta hydrolase [Aquisphaera insulae]